MFPADGAAGSLAEKKLYPLETKFGFSNFFVATETVVSGCLMGPG